MLINRLNVVSTLCKDTQLSPKTQYQNALGDKILLILKQVFTILKLSLDFSQRRTGLFRLSNKPFYPNWTQSGGQVFDRY